MTTPLGAIGAVSPAASGSAPAPAQNDVKQGEAFERMLLGQLTKTLVDSAMPADEEGSAAAGAYRQMLPDALTEALMSGGGVGLAAKHAGASTKEAA
jgi:Rod binding domain-containing protein